MGIELSCVCVGGYEGSLFVYSPVFSLSYILLLKPKQKLDFSSEFLRGIGYVPRDVTVAPASAETSGPKQMLAQKTAKLTV